ncbi:hypothetical protein Bbelb_218370 [Branchiostoma belcheri]|nr:hypothetical protein Bbelb_218370 [Branchiostoma belcheri]
MLASNLGITAYRAPVPRVPRGNQTAMFGRLDTARFVIKSDLGVAVRYACHLWYPSHGPEQLVFVILWSEMRYFASCSKPPVNNPYKWNENKNTGIKPVIFTRHSPSTHTATLPRSGTIVLLNGHVGGKLERMKGYTFTAKIPRKFGRIASKGRARERLCGDQNGTLRLPLPDPAWRFCPHRPGLKGKATLRFPQARVFVPADHIKPESGLIGSQRLAMWEPGRGTKVSPEHRGAWRSVTNTGPGEPAGPGRAHPSHGDITGLSNAVVVPNTIDGRGHRAISGFGRK